MPIIKIDNVDYDTDTLSNEAKAQLISMQFCDQELQRLQAEAAELFGVTQPRISDLTRGKIHLFSLDMLMNMASTAGMSPVVKLSKPKALPVKRTARTRSALAA